MQAVPTPGTRAAWPLAAICCLGLILFLIAAAIVLALIPVYLPTREGSRAVSDDRSTDPFYASFTADFPDDTFVPGQGYNLAATQSAFTSSKDVEFTGMSADNSALARRKRSWYGERQKRSILVLLIFEIRFLATQCNAKCLRDRKDFRTSLQKSDARSCDISINGSSLGNVTQKGLLLKFKDLVRAKPAGFRPIPTSDTFTCIKDGDFNDPSIWAGGFLPAGNCKIVIPAGFRVTHARDAFRINVMRITVAGTLILGAGSSTFTFRNPVNIRVLSGGTVQDATSSKRFLVALGSVLYAFKGATLCQAGTVIQSFSSAGVGSSFTLTTSSGPLTVAILTSGLILNYNKITFIAVSSGGFTSGSTFLGGLAPSADDCSAAACGVYIVPGVTLNTADLNGVLDINIDTFTIPAGAIFQLGTPGSSNGFKFKYPVQLNIIGGVLGFVASGGGIFLVPGSGFNLMGGGSFISGVATFIQVYDLLTGLVIGVPTVLGTSMLGPFFVTISATGVVTVGITPPGTLTTTTTTTTAGATAVMG